MNVAQIDSLVRTFLKVVGTILMTHGFVHAASAVGSVNCEDVAGLVVLLVSAWQSHQVHRQAAGGNGSIEDLKAIVSELVEALPLVMDRKAIPGHEDALDKINAELSAEAQSRSQTGAPGDSAVTILPTPKTDEGTAK